MGEIIVNSININKNVINIDYRVEGKIDKFFNQKEDFFVEYKEDIEDVPKGIAVIPFVVNVLPIIWLTDSRLSLPELDKVFFESIPKFKQGYKDMYKDVEFKGSIDVKDIKDYSYTPQNKCATFFSGGVDSYSTLINHLDEKTNLVALWGSDVKFEDVEGWNRVKNNITETANEYGLKPVFIKSSFRRFIDEGNLDKEFQNKLKDGWWHGIQHGIGLIGHIAPYAWNHKLSTQYIASSFCDRDKNVTCASYPTIDENVKFGGCKVVHDQFDFNRQDKIEYLISYCKNKQQKIKLRVCWKSDGGKNCCNCEKCFRTIVGILIEGENPNNYGFDVNDNILKYMKEYMSGYYEYTVSNSKAWIDLKNKLKINKKKIHDKSYYKYIAWIESYDFFNYNKNYQRKYYKLKEFVYINTKLRMKSYLDNLKFVKKTITPINYKKIYILNTPLHTNIGDSAIAYAQNLFLEKNFGNKYKIVEITSWELNRFRRVLSYIVRKKDIVMQHGGGNMGIEWFGEELERRSIIEMFPNNKMIIFPQTIYYGDSDKGKEEFEKSKQIYNSHKDLTVIAREKVSYDIMKHVYDKCKVILTPDIVLSMDGLENKYKRENITFCFRKDPEKVLKNSEQEVIIEECKKTTDKLVFTDMISERQVTKENRVDIIMDKFKDFQKSKLVITDRLHGMIFCALSGTPCIAFGNYNQKVKGTYEWIKDLDYINYVDNIEESKECINELMKLDTTKYDNSMFINYYDQIKDIINDTFREER